MSLKWSQEEISFLKENYKKKTYAQLSKEMNRSKNAISLKINQLGLKKSKYTYNHTYFKNIDTPNKAYWLGFIAADGNVSVNPETNSGEIKIILQAKDGNHLQKFNKSLNGNVEIKYGKRQCNLNGKIYSFSQIRLYSIEMANDLISYGIIPNKTFNLKFPSLNTSLIPHFIRGYFDGDGCITRNKRKNAIYDIKCDFTSADLNFLAELRKNLYENDIKSYFCICQNNIPKLVIGGMHNVDKFLNYIYKDATLYLDRKYNRKNELYKSLNIEQRLLRQSKRADFLLSEKETGEAEMPIRVEGYI